MERSRGGLGLGLALTKGLIQLHGGNVVADSDGLGRGADLHDQAALRSGAAARRPRSRPRRSPRQERILIIDDRRDAILPLNKMLQMDGHTVATALDGPTGLAMAMEFEPQRRPVRHWPARRHERLRSEPGLAGDCPQTSSAYLVAVTGYGHEEAKRMAKEAGFDYHLTKPLGRQQLRDVLARRPRF